jgi:outer membrane receptor protein involved in Fe transport
MPLRRRTSRSASLEGVSGRLKNIVAAIAASGCIVAANAEDLPGTTLRNRAAGWSASLFVAPPPDRSNYTDPPPPFEVPPVVNATISRRIAKGLSLSFDVKNVFNRPMPSDNYLFQPPQPRGFILGFKKTF